MVVASSSSSAAEETEEEERRRILAGIFAENDDDEDEEDGDDDDDDDSTAMSRSGDNAAMTTAATTAGSPVSEYDPDGSSSSSSSNNDDSPSPRVGDAHHQQRGAYFSSSSEDDGGEDEDDDRDHDHFDDVGWKIGRRRRRGRSGEEEEEGRGMSSESYDDDDADADNNNNNNNESQNNRDAATTVSSSILRSSFSWLHSSSAASTATIATDVEEEVVLEVEEVGQHSRKNSDNDYLVKAENTVLDEILGEAESPSSEEVTAREEGLVKNQQKMNPSTVSKSNNSSSSISSGGTTRVKDKVSLRTNVNVISNASTTPKGRGGGGGAVGLPDVFSTMRQKIEDSIFGGSDSTTATGGMGKSGSSSNAASSSSSSYPASLFSSNNTSMNNIMSNNNQSNDTDAADISNTSTALTTLQRYYNSEEERDAMRRTFQQCISAAVLVSLAHKRYERRRLAAMEIEKVVRTLSGQDDYDSVRAILLLLSDDYVRSTNEDARKGGAVALAACAIGLKKANDGGGVGGGGSNNNILPPSASTSAGGDTVEYTHGVVAECRDLILASVVHACQDHSQRVRYYATESLFNVTKVMPSLAVRHFFILFEILRSLYADVDLDVRSGAELLDKKLKEVIVGAINSGSFSADACVPVFARFVYMRNKPTKQLTLTWLREFGEKLVGAPILEFLHLFLGGIFAMVADPTTMIRQLALEFLQSVLPKLLVTNEDFEEARQKVDFDKILQSLVLSMEHPDPFVRKVAMYWMSRIVQAHMSSAFLSAGEVDFADARMVESTVMGEGGGKNTTGGRSTNLTAASISVRSALPHVLPGILLSIGDTHQSPRGKDTFLPDQTTHSLAEQANSCLQDAVRRDGKAFIPHLGGFIVALREELDSPGGIIARNPPSVERRPYRMDVKADGSGIESTGWFHASDGVEERDNALILSRLCALQWVIILYDNVVPNAIKADFADEFIDCIIYQLVDQPPGIIIVKSFEVLASISNPAVGEDSYALNTSKSLINEALVRDVSIPSWKDPMDEANANFALGILDPSERKLLSRDRSVFESLIDLYWKHQQLLLDISKVIELMCTLQPPEFVYVSFAYELDNFIVSRMKRREKVLESPEIDTHMIKKELAAFAKDLAFVSNFAQQLGIVFFAAPEAEQIRQVLKNSIGQKGNTVRDARRARMFHILLYTFSHNIVATLEFCLWCGAFLTASTFLQNINPLDVSLMFYLELDQLVDLIERPMFRHLHLHMLECDDDPQKQGSGYQLFRTLKSILMLLPQTTSYMILKERLTSMARYRQSAVALSSLSRTVIPGSENDSFVQRIASVRKLHCDAKWRIIRADSLEEPCRLISSDLKLTAAQQRREWLGYADEEEELASIIKMKNDMLSNTPRRAEMVGVYEQLDDNTTQLPQYKDNPDENESTAATHTTTKGLIKQFEQMNAGEEEKVDRQWRNFWLERKDIQNLPYDP